jgi:putative tryptophan/tyrosine transport system substrate-binding protein
MKRREFISLLGGTAVTWPLAARAQQPAMPVIGLLDISTPSSRSTAMAGFRRGLSEIGYVEGQNVTVEYRWAEGHFDRLAALAADLVDRQVVVIFAGGPPAVRAAKAQTATIPIVFFIGEDPVKEGLVTSLNRPGGNVTGVTNFQNQLFGKQLGVLRDIVPNATRFVLLVNPNNPNAEPDAKDAQAAADALRLELRVLSARTVDDLEPAFAVIGEQRVGALLIGVDGLFFDRREQMSELATRHAIPAISQWREYPAAGGLMSYGASRADAFRQAGIYTGRILKGAKPADLPVMQSTKFEFVINLKTAKALGLDVPVTLLATADDVIE